MPARGRCWRSRSVRRRTPPCRRACRPGCSPHSPDRTARGGNRSGSGRAEPGRFNAVKIDSQRILAVLLANTTEATRPFHQVMYSESPRWLRNTVSDTTPLGRAAAKSCATAKSPRTRGRCRCGQIPATARSPSGGSLPAGSSRPVEGKAMGETSICLENRHPAARGEPQRLHCRGAKFWKGPEGPLGRRDRPTLEATPPGGTARR